MKHFICFFIAILILLKSDLSLMLYMSCVYIICCIGMVEYELIYICRWATETTRFYCKKNAEKTDIHGGFFRCFFALFFSTKSRKATDRVFQFNLLCVFYKINF